MAFATSFAPAATNISTAADPHTVNINPSGTPNQNELLLCIGRIPAGNQSGTIFPTGWTQQFNVTQAGSSTDRICVGYKYLTAGAAEIGASTMSCDVDTATARLGAWLVWRILGAENPGTQAPQFATATTGTTANPDSGSVTPAGGTVKDYLIFTIGTAEGEQTTPYGTLPTNYSLYSGGANSGTGGAVATNCTMTGAARELNTGSAQDPGAFTMSLADDWWAMTVLIHPSSAPPPTSMPPFAASERWPRISARR